MRWLGSTWAWMVALLVGVGACSDPEQRGSADAGSNSGADAGFLFDTAKDSGGATGNGLVLTFAVDDSANKTFEDGQIVWTGSFSWDEKSNTITYATSWLPTDGPYPPLYDDGPVSKGGHEQEGATKGDHIFSTQVKYAPTEDRLIEYGALNELGNWMWVGPNGKLEIQKGQSGVVAVPGMKLPKHGDIDLKVTLDTVKLNACCSKWNTKDYAFYLKGTMNMWTPIQLLDNGQKGDEVAGDGVLTYIHKQNLGIHDGGLSAGDEVQFVFVTTKGDQTADAGAEYKAGTTAFADGVSAWASTGVAGAWQPLVVQLAKDSKGKVDNTAVIVPGGQTTGGGCSPPCADGSTCVGGSCQPSSQVPSITSVQPSTGPIGGGSAVTISGKGFAANAKVRFGDVDATAVVVSGDGTSISCTTPAAQSAGLVSVTVSNPGGLQATLAEAFAYQAPQQASVQVSGLAAGAQLPGGTALGVEALVFVPGATAAAGVTPDLQVWIGSGKVGSSPATDASWQWTAAAYAGEGANADERWGATLPGLASGSAAIAAKVVVGSGPAVYSAVVAVEVVDPAQLPAKLSAVVPPWVSTLGGTVELQGQNLFASGTVTLQAAGGATVAAVQVSATTAGLAAQLPALPGGTYTVRYTPKGGAAVELASALQAAPIATPKLSGDPAKSFGPALLVASNAVPTAWGDGKNQLSNLWVAYDAANLYVGIAGFSEANNAIVAYLDVDHGGGTGVAQPIDLKDNTGAVDDAIAGVLENADTSIGLDVALASIGMAGFGGGDLGQSLAAGWRALWPLDDFGWLSGTVQGTAGVGLEASVPLQTLYPKGLPPGGVKLRIAVALGNDNGAAISNQFLPQQAGASKATQLTTWATVPVFAVGAP
jgi:hypothetical protein